MNDTRKTQDTDRTREITIQNYTNNGYLRTGTAFIKTSRKSNLYGYGRTTRVEAVSPDTQGNEPVPVELESSHDERNIHEGSSDVFDESTDTSDNPFGTKVLAGFKRQKKRGPYEIDDREDSADLSTCDLDVNTVVVPRKERLAIITFRRALIVLLFLIIFVLIGLSFSIYEIFVVMQNEIFVGGRSFHIGGLQITDKGIVMSGATERGIISAQLEEAESLLGFDKNYIGPVVSLRKGEEEYPIIGKYSDNEECTIIGRYLDGDEQKFNITNLEVPELIVEEGDIYVISSYENNDGEDNKLTLKVPSINLFGYVSLSNYTAYNKVTIESTFVSPSVAQVETKSDLRTGSFVQLLAKKEPSVIRIISRAVSEDLSSMIMLESSCEGDGIHGFKMYKCLVPSDTCESEELVLDLNLDEAFSLNGYSLSSEDVGIGSFLLNDWGITYPSVGSTVSFDFPLVDAADSVIANQCNIGEKVSINEDGVLSFATLSDGKETKRHSVKVNFQNVELGTTTVGGIVFNGAGQSSDPLIELTKETEMTVPLVVAPPLKLSEMSVVSTKANSPTALTITQEGITSQNLMISSFVPRFGDVGNVKAVINERVIITSCPGDDLLSPPRDGAEVLEEYCSFHLTNEVGKYICVGNCKDGSTLYSSEDMLISGRAQMNAPNLISNDIHIGNVCIQNNTINLIESLQGIDVNLSGVLTFNDAILDLEESSYSFANGENNTFVFDVGEAAIATKGISLSRKLILGRSWEIEKSMKGNVKISSDYTTISNSGNVLIVSVEEAFIGDLEITKEEIRSDKGITTNATVTFEDKTGQHVHIGCLDITDNMLDGSSCGIMSFGEMTHLKANDIIYNDLMYKGTQDGKVIDSLVANINTTISVVAEEIKIGADIKVEGKRFVDNAGAELPLYFNNNSTQVNSIYSPNIDVHELLFVDKVDNVTKIAYLDNLTYYAPDGLNIGADTMDASGVTVSSAKLELQDLSLHDGTMSLKHGTDISFKTSEGKFIVSTLLFNDTGLIRPASVLENYQLSFHTFNVNLKVDKFVLSDNSRNINKITFENNTIEFGTDRYNVSIEDFLVNNSVRFNKSKIMPYNSAQASLFINANIASNVSLINAVNSQTLRLKSKSPSDSVLDFDMINKLMSDDVDLDINNLTPNGGIILSLLVLEPTGILKIQDMNFVGNKLSCSSDINFNTNLKIGALNTSTMSIHSNDEESIIEYKSQNGSSDTFDNACHIQSSPTTLNTITLLRGSIVIASSRTNELNVVDIKYPSSSDHNLKIDDNMYIHDNVLDYERMYFLPTLKALAERVDTPNYKFSSKAEVCIIFQGKEKNLIIESSIIPGLSMCELDREATYGSVIEPDSPNKLRLEKCNGTIENDAYGFGFYLNHFNSDIKDRTFLISSALEFGGDFAWKRFDGSPNFSSFEVDKDELMKFENPAIEEPTLPSIITISTESNTSAIRVSQGFTLRTTPLDDIVALNFQTFNISGIDMKAESYFVVSTDSIEANAINIQGHFATGGIISYEEENKTIFDSIVFGCGLILDLDTERLIIQKDSIEYSGSLWGFDSLKVLPDNGRLLTKRIQTASLKAEGLEITVGEEITLASEYGLDINFTQDGITHIYDNMAISGNLFIYTTEDDKGVEFNESVSVELVQEDVKIGGVEKPFKISNEENRIVLGEHDFHFKAKTEFNVPLVINNTLISNKILYRGQGATEFLMKQTGLNLAGTTIGYSETDDTIKILGEKATLILSNNEATIKSISTETLDAFSFLFNDEEMSIINGELAYSFPLKLSGFEKVEFDFGPDFSISQVSLGYLESSGEYSMVINEEDGKLCFKQPDVINLRGSDEQVAFGSIYIGENHVLNDSGGLSLETTGVIVNLSSIANVSIPELTVSDSCLTVAKKKVTFNYLTIEHTNEEIIVSVDNFKTISVNSTLSLNSEDITFGSIVRGETDMKVEKIQLYPIDGGYAVTMDGNEESITLGSEKTLQIKDDFTFDTIQIMDVESITYSDSEALMLFPNSNIRYLYGEETIEIGDAIRIQDLVLEKRDNVVQINGELNVLAIEDQVAIEKLNVANILKVIDGEITFPGQLIDANLLFDSAITIGDTFHIDGTSITLFHERPTIISFLNVGDILVNPLEDNLPDGFSDDFVDIFRPGRFLFLPKESLSIQFQYPIAISTETVSQENNYFATAYLEADSINVGTLKLCLNNPSIPSPGIDSCLSNHIIIDGNGMTGSEGNYYDILARTTTAKEIILNNGAQLITLSKNDDGSCTTLSLEEDNTCRLNMFNNKLIVDTEAGRISFKDAFTISVENTDEGKPVKTLEGNILGLNANILSVSDFMYNGNIIKIGSVVNEEDVTFTTNRMTIDVDTIELSKYKLNSKDGYPTISRLGDGSLEVTKITFKEDDEFIVINSGKIKMEGYTLTMDVINMGTLRTQTITLESLSVGSGAPILEGGTLKLGEYSMNVEGDIKANSLKISGESVLKSDNGSLTLYEGNVVFHNSLYTDNIYVEENLFSLSFGSGGSISVMQNPDSLTGNFLTFVGKHASFVEMQLPLTGLVNGGRFVVDYPVGNVGNESMMRKLRDTKSNPQKLFDGATITSSDSTLHIDGSVTLRNVTFVSIMEQFASDPESEDPLKKEKSLRYNALSQLGIGSLSTWDEPLTDSIGLLSFYNIKKDNNEYQIHRLFPFGMKLNNIQKMRTLIIDDSSYGTRPANISREFVCYQHEDPFTIFFTGKSQFPKGNNKMKFKVPTSKIELTNNTTRVGDKLTVSGKSAQFSANVSVETLSVGACTYDNRETRSQWNFIGDKAPDDKLLHKINPKNRKSTVLLLYTEVENKKVYGEQLVFFSKGNKIAGQHVNKYDVLLMETNGKPFSKEGKQLTITFYVYVEYNMVEIAVSDEAMVVLEKATYSLVERDELLRSAVLGQICS